MKSKSALLFLIFGLVLLANAANAESSNERPKQAVEQRQVNSDVNTFRDCADCPEMVVLSGGGPGQAFAIGKYEVTQAQWRAVMGNNPSNFISCGDTCPVEQVSWNDAHDFIKRLNRKTGKQYRLPTNAEWEYACQAGEQHDYCGSNDVGSVAWYLDNSNDTTHPVGLKQPNAFGLYDMSGNLREFVEDCFHDDCRFHVVRGGCFAYDAVINRAMNRESNLESDYRGSFGGFRIVRNL